jgi:hypothetical protein
MVWLRLIFKLDQMQSTWPDYLDQEHNEMSKFVHRIDCATSNVKRGVVWDTEWPWEWGVRGGWKSGWGDYLIPDVVEHRGKGECR